MHNSNLIPSQNLAASATETDDAPIIRYIRKLLADSIDAGVSDIHFEPYEKHYRIRCRLDGILYEKLTVPTNLANKITACIKIMAQLDISERRMPQDGRFKMTSLTNKTVDLRVSTCPMIYGEKIVLRILDASQTLLAIDNLGLENTQQKLLLNFIQKPQGIILVTGPTGSGKTVTLYTALTLLNATAVNIASVEDPVEIYLHGINQVNVNPKIGLSFATVLRALLRQDPDIIMLGEMRDQETAEIGIKAAQTGHLVLSTLHTNSAAETIIRLTNIGIPHYNIATAVTLIIAQRLMRRLCGKCKIAVTLSAAQWLAESGNVINTENITVYAAQGCEYCTAGYKGRIGIFEMLPISTSITQLILQNADAITIAQQARAEGMQTLREIALTKVTQGMTTLVEMHRVISG